MQPTIRKLKKTIIRLTRTIFSINRGFKNKTKKLMEIKKLENFGRK